MLKDFIVSTTKFILTVTAIVVLLILNLKMWSKDREQEETIQNLQKELVIQQQKNHEIYETNEKLHQRIDSLRRGSVEMIEEEARDKFNMIGEGETFIDFEPASEQN